MPKRHPIHALDIAAMLKRAANDRREISKPDGGGLTITATPSGSLYGQGHYRDGDAMRTKGTGPGTITAIRDTWEGFRQARKAARSPVALTSGAAPQPVARSNGDTPFANAAMAYLADGRAGRLWRDDGEEKERLIKRDLIPWLGDRPLNTIAPEEISEWLRPRWLASRNPISSTPGKLRDCLIGIFAARNVAIKDRIVTPKVKLPPIEARRQPSCPWQQAGGLWSRLGDDDVARAIRFQMGTAARPGEARQAHWGQIDLDRRTWTIKGDSADIHGRIVRGGAKAHATIVKPLSDAAMALLPPSRIGGPLWPTVTAHQMENRIRSMAIPDPTRNGELAVNHGHRRTMGQWGLEHDHDLATCKRLISHNQDEDLSHADQSYLDKVLKPLRKLCEDYGRFLCASAT